MNLFIVGWKDRWQIQDPAVQARAVYLAFGIENPLLSIPEKVKTYVDKIYKKQAEVADGKAIIIENKEEKEEILKRVGYFLVETGFAAEEKRLQAWGYSQDSSRATLAILSDKDLGLRYFRDILLFNRMQKTGMFPPQDFYLKEEVRKMYPKSESAITAKWEALKGSLDNLTQEERQRMEVEIYVGCMRRFYREHPDGLAAFFQNKLNYSMIGLNRFAELPQWYEKIQYRDGILVSLFSGPPDGARQEAYEAGCAAISVDKRTLEELRQDAFRIRQELVAGQRREDLLVRNGTEAEVEYQHITANLPAEWDKVREAVSQTEKPIAAITDKRGSFLYREGEDLLKNLEQIFILAQPGTVIYLSKGISRWAYVDMVLQKQADGSMRIIDCIPGLRTYDYQSYIDDAAYELDQVLSGAWRSDPELLEKILGRENQLLIEKFVRNMFIRDLLEKTISQLGMPIDNASWLTLDANLWITRRYFLTLIVRGQKAAEAFIQSVISTKIKNIKEIRNKSTNEQKMIAFWDSSDIDGLINLGVEHNEDWILTIAMLKAFDLDKFHQLVSWVAGESRITTSRQGIFLPEVALRGLENLLREAG